MDKSKPLLTKKSYMTVKIFLRSILHGETKSLALFDSNRKGAIDDLTTEVPAGATIIWKLDCCSGIRSITSVHYSSETGHTVFLREPKKRFLCKEFILKLDLEEEKEARKETYTIEYILCDDTKVTIDPVIRVPPPN